MRVEELDYALPSDLVAQAPLHERDGARLLIVRPSTRGVEHSAVRALPGAMPKALWVVNDTRVLAARLKGRKETGGAVEVLLLRRVGSAGRAERWEAMGRGVGRSEVLSLCGDVIRAAVVERRVRGQALLELSVAHGTVSDAVDRLGSMPLPPYIRREETLQDRERYQTVFASEPGAVAAPTAGLHLSRRLLRELRGAGHAIASITLHVGAGTFLPVRADVLSDHPMHREQFAIPDSTRLAIEQAKAEGRPVVAVGTTVVRALETAAASSGSVQVGAASTSLLIVPGHRFKVVDALLTNFHLPRSTLLALVMAFGGVELVRESYRKAVEARYRFYSYGDAMLLTEPAKETP